MFKHNKKTLSRISEKSIFLCNYKIFFKIKFDWALAIISGSYSTENWELMVLGCLSIRQITAKLFNKN